jgi:hypothetical protein
MKIFQRLAVALIAIVLGALSGCIVADPYDGGQHDQRYGRDYRRAPDRDEQWWRNREDRRDADRDNRRREERDDRRWPDRDDR